MQCGSAVLACEEHGNIKTSTELFNEHMINNMLENEKVCFTIF